MIVFCEDCGGKNTLPSAELKKEKIVFKCIFCAYPNKYKNKTYSKPDIISNYAWFSQLTSLKDIIGGLVYHRNDGVLVNHMPDSFPPDALDFMASNLLKNIDICQELNIDIEKMTLYITNYHTVVRQIDKNCIIVIVAATQKALYQISDMFNNLIPQSF